METKVNIMSRLKNLFPGWERINRIPGAWSLGGSQVIVVVMQAEKQTKLRLDSYLLTTFMSFKVHI